MDRPWTAVIYNSSTNVTYVTNELAPYEPAAAKIVLETVLHAGSQVLALIPGSHAGASNSWDWSPTADGHSKTLNCS
jgi:hypothetical protein